MGTEISKLKKENKRTKTSLQRMKSFNKHKSGGGGKHKHHQGGDRDHLLYPMADYEFSAAEQRKRMGLTNGHSRLSKHHLHHNHCNSDRNRHQHLKGSTNCVDCSGPCCCAAYSHSSNNVDEEEQMSDADEMDRNNRSRRFKQQNYLLRNNHNNAKNK